MRTLPVVLALLAALASDRAAACSCAPAPSPTEALAGAAAVFRGTVTDIDEPGSGCGGSSSADPVVVTFDVTTSWKGEVGRETQVITAREGATCGIDFVGGTEYIVYASDLDGDLHANLCSRTRSIGQADEDLNELGAGTAVTRAWRGARRTRLAGAGLLGLVLVVLGWSRRR